MSNLKLIIRRIVYALINKRHGKEIDQENCIEMSDDISNSLYDYFLNDFFKLNLLQMGDDLFQELEKLSLVKKQELLKHSDIDNVLDLEIIEKYLINAYKREKSDMKKIE